MLSSPYAPASVNRVPQSPPEPLQAVKIAASALVGQALPARGENHAPAVVLLLKLIYFNRNLTVRSWQQWPADMEVSKLHFEIFKEPLGLVGDPQSPFGTTWVLLRLRMLQPLVGPGHKVGAEGHWGPLARVRKMLGCPRPSAPPGRGGEWQQWEVCCLLGLSFCFSMRPGETWSASSMAISPWGRGPRHMGSQLVFSSILLLMGNGFRSGWMLRRNYWLCSFC